MARTPHNMTHASNREEVFPDDGASWSGRVGSLGHLCWIARRSPVNAARCVVSELCFERTRMHLRAALLVLVAAVGIAMLAGTAPEVRAETRIVQCVKPPAWWEWIRNRWPMRESKRVVAASGA